LVEADTIPSASAKDGAKTYRREDGEEQGEEPVGELDGTKGVARHCVVKVAEAQERPSSGRWLLDFPPAFDSGIPRMRTHLTSLLRHRIAYSNRANVKREAGYVRSETATTATT
jgi:hypothetical protein